MRKLGQLKEISTAKQICIDIKDLHPGVNDIKNHFVRLSPEGEVEFVIDKVCNHAGGRLILKGNQAICPMHDWRLDLDSLQYNNSHICKNGLEFSQNENGNILLTDYDKNLLNPFKNNKKGKLKVRWLNHATVHLECNGVTLITDPWLFGPAFMTGWWLAEPSPKDSIDLLKSADYVYISHNHPDHLHPETLAVLPRDKQIIVPDFYTKSCEKYLKSLNFNNILPLSFNEVFEIAEDFQISILKSGDFRDDSGIYIQAAGRELLLTVDAKFLNSHVLPLDIDVLMTSFAGGASGFPLCFDNFSFEEKTKIVKRNKKSSRFVVHQYLAEVRPKYYMPYAGMFKERAARDIFISQNNQKNTVADYKDMTDNLGTTLIHPSISNILIFEEEELIVQTVKQPTLRVEDPTFYIQRLQKEYQYVPEKIITYLEDAKYYGEQILQIIPVSDDFSEIIAPIIFADFSKQEFSIISEEELLIEKEGCRVMQIKVRPESLVCVVENKLPWEDIAIGFQMRVTRVPNTYESDFWYHFTNIYIGEKDFRYSTFCGACTVIEHNPIWV